MTLGHDGDSPEAWKNEVNALSRVESALHEVNMGGTAIGTGLNAPAGFSGALCRTLEDYHRDAHPAGREPDRSHAGYAGLRAVLLDLEELVNQAVEGETICACFPPGRGLDLMKSTFHPCSKAPRSCRESEPGHPRGGQSSLFPGNRQ